MKSDVHSQQRFHYMGATGEVKVDQAHRGYSVSTDAAGYGSVNPLFMKYTPSNGYFSGQSGYGYKSFETFVDAARAVNAGSATPGDFDSTLPTIASTVGATAILEAGRRSLDAGGPFQRLLADLARAVQTVGEASAPRTAGELAPPLRVWLLVL